MLHALPSVALVLVLSHEMVHGLSVLLTLVVELALDLSDVRLQLVEGVLAQEEVGLQLVDRHVGRVQVVDQIGVLHAELVDLVLHTDVLVVEVALLRLELVDQFCVFSVEELSGLLGLVEFDLKSPNSGHILVVLVLSDIVLNLAESLLMVDFQVSDVLTEGSVFLLELLPHILNREKLLLEVMKPQIPLLVELPELVLVL